MPTGSAGDGSSSSALASCWLLAWAFVATPIYAVLVLFATIGVLAAAVVAARSL